MTLWTVRSDGMLCAGRRGALAGMLTIPAITTRPQPVLGAREEYHKGDVPCMLHNML